MRQSEAGRCPGSGHRGRRSQPDPGAAVFLPAVDAMTSAQLLEVENLRVTYGGTLLALRDLSFSVPEAGAVALLGANGAGKTTALRAVTGLLRFHGGHLTGGSIRFGGRAILRADAA